MKPIDYGISYFSLIKTFEDSTHVKVHNIYDVPKLIEAMEAFGWFANAKIIREATVSIQNHVMAEIKEAVNGLSDTQTT